jgi:hypothetical protein
VLLALLASGACSSGTAGGVPAVLVDPSPAVRAELQRIVGAAAGAPDVILGASAFVHETTLVVERRRQLAADGTRIAGRVIEEPIRFELQREGRDCVVVRLDTRERWRLAGADCSPP